MTSACRRLVVVETSEDCANNLSGFSPAGMDTNTLDHRSIVLFLAGNKLLKNQRRPRLSVNLTS